MKALIEIDPNDKKIKSIDAFSAFLGFSSLDYEIVEKSYFDLLKDNKLADIDVVFGSLNFTRQALRCLDYKLSDNFKDYPLFGRFDLYNRISQVELLTEVLKKFHKGIFKTRFIKPVKTKYFHTMAIKNKQHLQDFEGINLNKIHDDVFCYHSPILEILSEYRLYVQEGQVIGACYYKGDFRITLEHFHWHKIEFILDEIHNKTRDNFEIMPKAYSLDVCIHKQNHGATIPNFNDLAILECNDGYALGNYGLDSELFAKFILTRWNELKEYSQDYHKQLSLEQKRIKANSIDLRDNYEIEDLGNSYSKIHAIDDTKRFGNEI